VAKHPLIGSKVRFGISTFADTAETRLELSELSEDLILPTLATGAAGRATRARLTPYGTRSRADIALLNVSGFQVHPAGGVLPLRRPAHREGDKVAGVAG
jgi:hypothetical protein